MRSSYRALISLLVVLASSMVLLGCWRLVTGEQDLLANLLAVFLGLFAVATGFSEWGYL